MDLNKSVLTSRGIFLKSLARREAFWELHVGIARHSIRTMYIVSTMEGTFEMVVRDHYSHLFFSQKQNLIIVH